MDSRIYKSAFVLLCATLALPVASPVLAQGQSGSTFHATFDGSGVFDHPCNTELLQCSGNSGVTIHESFDQQGHNHLTLHFQDQDLKCVGLDSGTVYKSAFAQTIHRNNLTAFSDCLEATCTSSFHVNWHMIGQGQGDKLRSRSEAKVTFNANGELIHLDFVETTLSCD